MDSDSMSNFIFNNGGDFSNVGFDQMGSFSTIGNNNGGQMMEPQNDSGSSYPLLLRQYFQQQQQQQDVSAQQFSPSSVMDNNNAMGFAGMQNQMGMNQTFTGYDTSCNMGMQDRFNNWTGGPPSMTGTQSSSQSDLSTSERMLLGGMQSGANASFMDPNTPSAFNTQSFMANQSMHMNNPGLMNSASLMNNPSLMNNSSLMSNPSLMNANSASFMNTNTLPVRDIYAEQGILGPWSERSAGLLGKMFCADPSNQEGKIKRAKRKQPKDKPKRPLSAYNIFFKEERARLLSKAPDADGAAADSNHQQKRTPNGKIGFENLAKIIGGKWQDLGPSEVEYYKNKAASDMERYKKEMEEYNKKQAGKATQSEDEDDEVLSHESKKQRTV